MPEEFLYTIEEAEQLVGKFLDKTLPKEDWTHEAHLITGFYLLVNHEGDALDRMRKHLKAYNESVGGVNDERQGYHETMTVFWLWKLKKFAIEILGGLRWDNHALDELIFDEGLAERNCWLEYYSREKMFSVEARLEFVEPDLEQMD